MSTPRGKVWFSKRREALKLGVERHGFYAEHQSQVQRIKVGCRSSKGGYKSSKRLMLGVTASTFNFLEHHKSRGDIMKQIRGIASKKHQSIAFWVLMLWKVLQKAGIFKAFRSKGQKLTNGWKPVRDKRKSDHRKDGRIFLYIQMKTAPRSQRSPSCLAFMSSYLG